MDEVDAFEKNFYRRNAQSIAPRVVAFCKMEINVSEGNRC